MTATNSCGCTVTCDDPHNCGLHFICNEHRAGFHVAQYGNSVRTHSAVR